MARRHLTTAQKQNLIREQLKATPEQSDRQIAKALGVSQPTVSTQRKELEAVGGVKKFITSTDTLGRKQPRNRKPVSVFNPTRREEKALSNPEVIERMQETGTSVLVAKQKVLNKAKAERKTYMLSNEMPADCAGCSLQIFDMN